MIKVLGVEHIGIALDKNEQLSRILKDVFNLEYIGSEVIEEQGVNTDIFNVSNTKIELLESISKDSPISKYISKYGKGMHHIALIVEDINAAIEHLLSNNIGNYISINSKYSKSYEFLIINDTCKKQSYNNKLHIKQASY